MLGMGSGGMVLAAVLAAGGYAATTDGTQTASALDAIRMGFIWIPFIGYTASAIALLFNNIDKIEGKMTADLAAKHAQEAQEIDAEA
jgi:GPH family glycoside/pentoside/hexuronide:cation symporter